MAGISKQAFHKKNRPKEDTSMLIGAFIAEADLLRKAHPGCGVAKIYDTLKPNWIGRVNGVKLLYSYGFKLQKRINYKRTTFSVSSPYHNLIEGMLLTNKNQVWQSDLTFIWIGGRFYYLVFIIDIYTKQIVGYSVSDNMRTACNLKALHQAFRSQKGQDLSGLVHHSDRGSQYGDHRYRKQLEDRGIWISMGMMAQANAYAESFTQKQNLRLSYARWFINNKKGQPFLDN